MMQFQSTPPHGGRHEQIADLTGIKRFNPRPRMGGDEVELFDGGIAVVSIHAPAWGATGMETRPLHSGKVSIHAPAWGATTAIHLGFTQYLFQSTPPHGGRPGLPIRMMPSSCFNPRPRMGGDPPKENHMEPDELFQSTPPHGGRHRSDQCLDRCRTVSIHAPAWGATTNHATPTKEASWFQSTPPHGGRRRWR